MVHSESSSSNLVLTSEHTGIYWCAPELTLGVSLELGPIIGRNGLRFLAEEDLLLHTLISLIIVY